MELVAILRLLSRRPILAGLGALAAIALGVLVAGGPTQRSGTASARLVLDTDKSQLIHQAPSGGETLPWRTVLLADLAASRPVTEHITSEVGIQRGELVVVHPELAAPFMPASLPNRAAKAASVTSEKYVLTVGFDELLPIISLEAKAPDRGRAVRMVEAAAGALKETGMQALETPGSQGLSVEGTQVLSVESVGPVRSNVIVDKPQPLLGAALALVLFGLWSAALALIPRLLSAWRFAGLPARPA